MLRSHPPATNEELRRQLYQGALFLLDPTAATGRLVEDANRAIAGELGETGDVRTAQFRLSDGEFFTRIGRLRRLFYTTPPYHEAVRAVVRDLGFDPSRIAFDPIRLRT